MKYYCILLLALAICSCSQKPDAQKIIDKSIAFYGMDKLNQKTISFDFREKHFLVRLNGGNYFYESTFTTDSLGKVKDQLSNKGFVRQVNGLVCPQLEKDSINYMAAINSVVYFALLPLKLNDAATQKKYLRTIKIKDKNYEQIQVSFSVQNGGKDHDDVFYFWFDSNDYSMDYFAYSSGGNRFRAVSAIKEVNGLKLQNYINYKALENEKNKLLDYSSVYEQNNLIKLSEINFENIKLE